MNAIKAIRKRLRFSQAEIGKALGMSQANVMYLERGQTVMPETAKKLIAFAKVHGLEIGLDHIYAGAELPAAPQLQTQES